jgi:hypothetical protein
MLSIETLLEQIKQDPLCKVFPPVGLPVLPEGLKLPADLEYFYRQCGGIQCFYNCDLYGFYIEPPKGFISANSFCLSSLSVDELIRDLGVDHFSWKWYLIANFGGGNSECAAISLNEDDLGSIYNCEIWTAYPSKEELFATSFTDFLGILYHDRGATHRRKLFGFF